MDKRVRLTRKTALLLFCFLFFLTLHGSERIAHADAAPPPAPLGSDPSPSILNTNVRMVSEFVLLDIAGYSSYRAGHANVTAQFFMRNLGETSERMRVRFPMNHAEYYIDYELETGEEYCEGSPYPSIAQIRVWVDGEPKETDITYKTLSNPYEEEWKVTPCWAYFDVVFPPHEDVNIKVSYIVSGYDYNGWEAGEVEFAYVLETGVGWKDTIGKADIVARLPYDSNDLNFSNCMPGDCVISGKEISWHFEDFEPEGNIELRIVRPSIWQRILTETEITQRNPKDGQAWGRLARAYKEAITAAKGMLNTYEPRSSEMYSRSRTAYLKAIELLPEDPGWHYGFADLLCNYAQWSDSSNENWVACFDMLKQTLEIDPNYEEANELLETFAYWGIVDLGGPEPDYLILTPHPTATATGTVTRAPPEAHPLNPVTKGPPTRTAMPRRTPSPTVPPPSPERSDSGLLLGAGFLAAIAIVVFVLWRKRQ